MGMLEDFLGAHIDVATDAFEDAVETVVNEVTANDDDDDKSDD